MLARIRSRLSYANVMSSFALFIALTTGGVYAANEWTGANIVDGSLTYHDIATNTIGSGRIANESITATDLAPGSVGTSEVADGALGNEDLGADSVFASEIADGAIDSGEIVDNSLSAVDLASNSVGAAELAGNSVDGANVINNSLSLDDFSGTNVNGVIGLPAGAVANGRCKQYTMTVGGAVANDAIVVSLRAAVPDGVVMYGVRVPANGQGILAVCNFTGGVFPAIVDLPIKTVTFN